MLSSSPLKIHEPPVPGVSPRPTDRRQRQKTAKHEGMWHGRVAADAWAQALRCVVRSQPSGEVGCAASWPLGGRHTAGRSSPVLAV
jgi:hypothetical protein